MIPKKEPGKYPEDKKRISISTPTLPNLSRDKKSDKK